MLKHGENIIDTLGAEVDRLEKELKVERSYTPILCSFLPSVHTFNPHCEFKKYWIGVRNMVNSLEHMHTSNQFMKNPSINKGG